MTVSNDEYAAYEVTEQDFMEACKRASFFTKKRILKKMQKVVHRAAAYFPKRVGPDKEPIPAGVYTKPVPPSNVEEAVKSFVFCNRAKRTPNELQMDKVRACIEKLTGGGA